MITIYNEVGMFKIRKRQKSVSKLQNINRVQSILQFNRYRCLKEISDTEQHWKNLLRNELEMGSTIVAFQNVEISMRVDAQKKLMLRQTFMLKKQIITLIVSQQYEQILPKLELLRKTSVADSGLATLFIDFYHIQKQIIANKLDYRPETIKQIKSKMQKYYDKLDKEKGSIIYGRILYVAALHLIKLDGVLLKNEDINIVAQALTSKKKELCMISSDIQKNTLESLLFLTFEFYKILYLLKRDQDLMTQYYNQIQAYISIYKTKCGNFQEFQRDFKIADKIEKMKPLSLNLKIYDDHDRRRVLSLRNTEEQLMKNHFPLRNATVLSTQISAEMKNREKRGLTHMNSFQSSYDRNEQSESKLNDSEPAILKQALSLASKESEQQNICWTKKFCFQFIKPDELGIINGKFQVVFSDNFEEFQVRITVTKKLEIVGMFKIGFFPLEKQKSLGDCAKKLWRVIKERFYTDKTEFLPNLFSFEYPPFNDIPKHINVSYELPILVRIHQMLLHYLRKQPKTAKLNGQVILFPQLKSEHQKKQFQAPEPESKIFAKRFGFISFNKKLLKLHSIRNVKLIAEDQEGENELSLTFFTKEQSEYLTIHVEQGKQGKKILICSKNQRNVKSERNVYLEKQKIEKLCSRSQNEWRRKRVANIIDYMQNYKEEDQYFTTDNIYVEKNNHMKKNIEEEFEVMKSPILETKLNEIKSYSNFDYSRYRLLTSDVEPPAYKTVKIQNRYVMFRKKILPHYTYYCDGLRQFIVCPENADRQLIYTKFRLYKAVTFRNVQHQYVKASCVKKKNEDTRKQIKVKRQKIELKWMKTKIGKATQSKNYYFLNVFKSGQGTVFTVYDFKSGKNYIGEFRDKLQQNQWNYDDILNRVSSRISLRQFATNRNCICDAEEFCCKTTWPKVGT